MCISLWAQDCHPLYSLLLLCNRDELVSRPTLPAHWWSSAAGDGEQQQQRILGGRDLKEGGTWLGCSTAGRLALVTNFRESEDEIEAGGAHHRSRGHLTTHFLQSSKPPRAFLDEDVAPAAHLYNGFNLLVADLRTGDLLYCSNRPKAEAAAQGGVIVVRAVPGRLHGLSNACLDTPWPKVERGLRKLQAALADHPGREPPDDALLDDVLMDRGKPRPEDVPCTGASPEVEYQRSSIFVDYHTPEGRHSTRSMTVVAVRRDGSVSFKERYWDDAQGGAWRTHAFQFRIPPPLLGTMPLPCRQQQECAGEVK